MRLTRFPGAALLSLAAAMLFPAAARGYTNDREVRPPLNYFTLVPPVVGASYLDPAFGTSIRRISDARNQPNNADTGNLAFIVNEYATMSPFNRDDSWLLLQHQSYFAAYDGEGRYQKDLPFEINAASEPRWSRQDPSLLYYVSGNRLKSYNVASGATGVVRTFNEYAKVGGRGESDLCFDGDHLVLVGDSHDIFVYELSTDTKGPVLDASGHPFDSVHIAPGDQVVVTWIPTGSGAWNGIDLYDRGMVFLRKLATAIGHMDVGRDSDGQPIVLWINAGDPQPPPDCLNAVVKIRLADGHRTCVLPLDWGLSAHVSAPDDGGWFFVSTYAPTDPSPAAGGWRRYGAELLQVRLDGSEVRRLAHHRSRPFNDYWYMPRASVSRDGRRLVFSSNYGLPSILGHAPAYVDTYMVDLTAAVPAYPGSQSLLRTRYEQDAAAVDYAGSWLANGMSVHSGGSAVLAMDAGARSRFAFSGSAVSWIGYRDQWSGIARVYVDDQLRASIDSYAPVLATQSVLFSIDELAPGSHTLEIEATGTRNLLAAGAWVWVDAFDAAARLEQDDAAVGYSGAWQDSTLAAHSGDSAVRADQPGARATIRFTGTAVSWIGYRDQFSGIAQVRIDDIPRAELDTFSATAQAQAVLYTLTGLPPAEHTLAIEATGRRNPLSLGDWVWVDAFESASW